MRAPYPLTPDQLRQHIDSKGVALFKVVTGSMEPLIRIGDRIQVVKRSRPIERFDILLFWNGEVPVCHLVWHVNHLRSETGGLVYITCPFNPKFGNREDLPVPEEQVLGHVISHRIGWLDRIRLAWRRRL
jgi:signal peptidase I